MRLLIQRVKYARVAAEGRETGAIGPGLLVLAGFEDADTEADLSWGAAKVAQLRIFDDSDGVMNLSVMDVDGGLLVVSQFTLHALTRRGNRPSYIKAAKSETAVLLYRKFCSLLALNAKRPVATGKFGAVMEVELLNDGPVTIWIDTKNKE